MTSTKAPGPTGTPIGGNLWSFRKNIFKLLEEGRVKYGDIVRYRILNRIYHLVSHPDEINTVMIEKRACFSRCKTQSSELLHDITGNSILTLEGDAWVERKKLTGSSFSKINLNKYINSIAQVTNNYIKDITENPNGLSNFNIQKEISFLTAGLAGQCFFGSQSNWSPESLENSTNQILSHHWQRIKGIFDLIHKLPTNSRRQFDQGINYIKTIVKNIHDNYDQKTDTSLLTQLINARDGDHHFSTADLQSEIITFLLAGHETTSTALQWCFYNLALHPEWQEIIYHESQSQLTPDNLNADLPEKLVQTKYFFNETLRLYPPVWLLERSAQEETSLNQFQIPRNSTVVIAPLITHKHPEFWDSPNTFDPYRFEPSLFEKSKVAYLPFGRGPHTCIGQSFATLECFYIISQFVRNFKIEFVDKKFKPEFDVGITLRMTKPLIIKLRPRAN